LQSADFSRVHVGIAPVWKHIEPFAQKTTSRDEG